MGLVYVFSDLRKGSIHYFSLSPVATVKGVVDSGIFLSRNTLLNITERITSAVEIGISLLKTQDKNIRK